MALLPKPKRSAIRAEEATVSKLNIAAYTSGDGSHQAKTINRSFLNKLSGLPAHDAEQIVTEAGFSPMTIEHGHMVAMMLMPDVIQLWQAEDGQTISSAGCGDSSQIVEDV